MKNIKDAIIRFKLLEIFPFNRLYKYYLIYIKKPINSSAEYWDKRYLGGEFGRWILQSSGGV